MAAAMTDQVQADTIDGNAHPCFDLIKDLRVHDGEQCFGKIIRHIVYFAKVIESKVEMVRGVRVVTVSCPGNRKTACKPQPTEESERVVHRGRTDMAAPIQHQRLKFISRRVGAGPDETLVYGLSAACIPDPVFLEYPLGFCLLHGRFIVFPRTPGVESKEVGN